MSTRIPGWIKPGFWGAVLGVVLAVIVGFRAGWVVTSGTAEQTAESRAEKAVLAALTPICVAQFREQAKAVRTTQLAALQKERSWERGDYVVKQGWATMPGNAKPNNEVAAACASELLKAAAKPSAKVHG